MTDKVWIELEDGKDLSRLLYTNPVCFLSTSCPNHALPHNVMVLSWLTATNNKGDFCASINRRRATAARLERDFALSVPVLGMEQLVRNVGAVSGRWGVSKFPEDHVSLVGAPSSPTPPQSKRQKRKGPKFPHGIPGLRRVPMPDTNDLFAIDGTVAHLACELTAKLDKAPLTDADHYLLVAKVVRAWVHPDYWAPHKRLFRPTPSALPYLTFFGSQQFGHVVVGVATESQEDGT